MGAVQVVNLVGYRVELFVLEWYEGVAAVGIYSIAMQAAEAMWLIPAAIATAITGPAVHDDEADATRLVTRSALRAFYTGGVAVVVGAAAPWVIRSSSARTSTPRRSRSRCCCRASSPTRR